MPSITMDRDAAPPRHAVPVPAARLALLGCGTVGRALTRLASSPGAGARPVEIIGALVRDARRARALPLPPLTEDPHALLAGSPDVVIELLGGIDPARSLVAQALSRSIPVVTANKALLARHGAELRELAHRSGTVLLDEAAVIAGVPFLGTFSRRPLAASVTALTAIANGTSNFVLTRCANDGSSVDEAVADAQRRGYAEPDPHQDVSGADARDKLAVLLQHFAHVDVAAESIETEGLDAIPRQLSAGARALGGVIKPVILAHWRGDALEAFAGPAFVAADHPLAHVDGVDNALVLDTPRGRLLFQGPGAGPDVTAATVLDDVQEVLAGGTARPWLPLTRREVTAPETGWVVTLEAARLPDGPDVADLFAAHGLFAHRVGATHAESGREHRSLLLWPAARPVVQCALAALAAASGCTAGALRAIGAPR